MLGAARIDQLDPHPRIEEGKLAVAVLELLEIELDDILERVGRGEDGDARPLLDGRRGPPVDQPRARVAMLEAHPMLPARAPDRPFAHSGHPVDAAAPPNSAPSDARRAGRE